MKLYIPQIGDRIKLLADWTFDLYNETRNSTLMDFIGDTRSVKYRWNTLTTIPVTIPAGEILKIDRIYIRKGQDEFDSITFYWEGARSQAKLVSQPWDPERPTKTPARAVRFWAKMADVNTIEFDHV